MLSNDKNVISFIQCNMIWKITLILSYQSPLNSYTFCFVKHHASNDMQQKIDKSFHPILVLTRTSYSAIKFFAHLQFDFLVLTSYMERLYFDEIFITSLKNREICIKMIWFSLWIWNFYPLPNISWNNKWSSILKL